MINKIPEIFSRLGIKHIEFTDETYEKMGINRNVMTRIQNNTHSRDISATDIFNANAYLKKALCNQDLQFFVTQDLEEFAAVNRMVQGEGL